MILFTLPFDIGSSHATLLPLPDPGSSFNSITSLQLIDLHPITPTPAMSEETHDPLDLLRASISSSLPAVLLTAASEPASSLSLAAYISFPQASGESINITKDHSTRYTSKAGQSSEFYNIAQLWLAWTEKDSGVREYLVKGQAGGVGSVSVADRRGVVEFLQGGDGGGRVVKAGQAGMSGLSAGGSGSHSVPETGAASAAVEAAAGAMEAAGPSKPAAPVKRKYEVDAKDREFCKKASVIVIAERLSLRLATGRGDRVERPK